MSTLSWSLDLSVRTGDETVRRRSPVSIRAAIAVVSGVAPATPDTTAIAARIETGLRLLTVSSPVRTLRSSDQDNVDMAAFGLDPPRRLVSLTAADSATATVAFGAANPAQTSQYVRVIGRAAVYLMPRHVGAEWD